MAQHPQWFCMNRRGFLKALTGGGALIAASQLLSFAKDAPLVFPLRGRWERLSVGYVRIGPLLKGILAGHLHIDVHLLLLLFFVAKTVGTRPFLWGQQ